MTTTPTLRLGEHEEATEALTRTRSLVAPALDAAVARLNPDLRAACRHHLAGGGKHVRAGLVLTSAAAVGGKPQHALVGAVAVELVHNFSLVHDDIIDGDIERRHRPTVWAEYGVGNAIITGDALVTLALQLLLEDGSAEAVRAAGVLAEATQAMIAGQSEDMASEQRESLSVEECLHMEAGKTGALLSCAAALGAILGGGSGRAVEALSEFGHHLGIAFQAIDDVLGIWGEPAVTGKPVGNDLRLHKKTLPVALACASPDVPDGLRRLLATELSPDDVELAARMLDEHGARAATLAIGESHLATALDALHHVSLERSARAELVAIARYVTARDR